MRLHPSGATFLKPFKRGKHFANQPIRYLLILGLQTLLVCKNLPSTQEGISCWSAPLMQTRYSDPLRSYFPRHETLYLALVMGLFGVTQPLMMAGASQVFGSEVFVWLGIFPYLSRVKLHIIFIEWLGQN